MKRVIKLLLMIGFGAIQFNCFGFNDQQLRVLIGIFDGDQYNLDVQKGLAALSAVVGETGQPIKPTDVSSAAETPFDLASRLASQERMAAPIQQQYIRSLIRYLEQFEDAGKIVLPERASETVAGFRRKPGTPVYRVRTNDKGEAIGPVNVEWTPAQKEDAWREIGELVRSTSKGEIRSRMEQLVGWTNQPIRPIDKAQGKTALEFISDYRTQMLAEGEAPQGATALRLESAIQYLEGLSKRGRAAAAAPVAAAAERKYSAATAAAARVAMAKHGVPAAAAPVRPTAAAAPKMGKGKAKSVAKARAPKAVKKKPAPKKVTKTKAKPAAKAKVGRPAKTKKPARPVKKAKAPKAKPVVAKKATVSAKATSAKKAGRPAKAKKAPKVRKPSKGRVAKPAIAKAKAGKPAPAPVPAPKRAAAPKAAGRKPATARRPVAQNPWDLIIPAIERGDLATVQHLVPAQISASAVTRGGRSLLQIAEYHNQLAVENYLRGVMGMPAKPRGPRDVKRAAAAVIRFYNRNEPYYEFTNFAPGYPIQLDGKTWPTTEHYFQAQKFPHRADIQEEIRTSRDARAAFDAARRYAANVRLDWNDAKDGIMLKAIRAKAGQHAAVANMLTGTGDAVLVEATGGNDIYWGVGADGMGMNRLGVVLMKVRDELNGQPVGGLLPPIETKQWFTTRIRGG